MKGLSFRLLVVILFYVSCTPYKKVPYFGDLSKDSVSNETITNFYPITIQPNDLLGINVNSLNHEADLVFNYNLLREPNVSDIDRTDQSPIVGYLVDKDGNINLPLVGLVKAGGYCTKVFSDTLASKLQGYLSKPVVNVRILNFKISVLGDVKNPGSFSVRNERITFPEAISLAGDLNTTGIRNNILLIREEGSKRTYVHLNLQSKNLFTSPYYYLKNNDVIYVQPGRTKVSSDSNVIEKLSLGLSLISIVVYLIIRR